MWLFFIFFPVNVRFNHIAGILAMNVHGSCLCAFQCWKPGVFMEFHCSEEPWETSDRDIPSDGPISGLGLSSPQGRPTTCSTCSPAAPAHSQNLRWSWICADVPCREAERLRRLHVPSHRDPLSWGTRQYLPPQTAWAGDSCQEQLAAVDGKDLPNKPVLNC